MKYSKDDCRAKGKPGDTPSKGPIYLTDGVKKDADGEWITVPNMYRANPGPNRHTRRKIDAAFRAKYGKVAFAKMAKERKENARKVKV